MTPFNNVKNACHQKEASRYTPNKIRNNPNINLKTLSTAIIIREGADL